MPGGPVGRGPFVIVKQVNQDRPVGSRFIPDRRRVLEVAVQKREAGVADGRRWTSVGCPVARRCGTGSEAPDRQEKRNGEPKGRSHTGLSSVEPVGYGVAQQGWAGREEVSPPRRSAQSVNLIR